MSSKDRVKLVLNGRIPDRAPRDYWAAKEVNARLIKHYKVNNLDELLDLLDIDFRYVKGPEYTGLPLEKHADGSEDDIWGVPRKIVHVGAGEFKSSYKTVVSNPLANCKNVDEILNYEKWPSPKDFDYTVIKEQTKKHDGRAIMFMGDRLNRVAQLKPAMYLRGISKILADMRRKNNEIFLAIIDRIRSFYSEYLHEILKAAGKFIDIVVTGDDFGTQERLLMKPEDWRRFLKPGFKKFIDIAKSFGKIVMHHSCGSIRPIIPDMIECGLDILNPVQPDLPGMNHTELKAEFGSRLVFHGGISLQGPLRFGSRKQIHEEVKKRVKELGKNGGYIICTAHNMHADLKTENITSLFEAYDKFT
ncbi:MAG: uroporphyrinogen decarboxylase family protein [Promethearchaeota archaeon]